MKGRNVFGICLEESAPFISASEDLVKAIIDSTTILDYWSNNFGNELLASKNRGKTFYNLWHL